MTRNSLLIASWLVVIEYKLHTARTCSVIIPLDAAKPSGIAWHRQGRCNAVMSTKSREVIWGGTIMGAEIAARHDREEAQKAAREANRAEAYAWSVRMEGYGGPAQPSPTIGQCIRGGLGWLEVECNRCKIRASLPLDAIRRSRDTPIWKLEASLKCRSCRKGRAPPVRMIKLSERQEITHYKWAHPDDDDRR
jgi:hypothetical protein